jgi:regulator of sigma E protease
MGVFNQILQFVLSLSILVILHEFGHYMFARLFNTKVEKFYLFFNPWFALFKKKVGDTEYGIGWLPLGGYVKIAGMIDESMDKDQMQQPPQPFEYRSKPAWQRMLIISGGVLVNFVLALIIYSMVLYTWGESYLPTKNLTYGITCEPIAEEIGFRNGDKIITVNGQEIESFYQVGAKIILESSAQVLVERNGELVDISVSPSYIPQLIKSPALFHPRIPLVIGLVGEKSAAEEAGLMVGDELIAINGTDATFFDEFKSNIQASKNQNVTLTMNRNGNPVDILVNVPETGIIGIVPRSPLDFFELKKINYSFFQSIPAGINRGTRMISNYLKQLKLVFSPKTRAYESVGGFITIGSIFPKFWDWQSFWELTAFLSIILAIMNMLPIPALDGGHMLFIAYEMVSGRKPSDKFLEYAQIVGMVFILSLVFFANANDVIKLFK